ncbi:hypothetical protein [Aeromicrobium sp. UC242_57]|uniref:hypothetical protein n=1 Tax=Aeromicrobium sp. UC242_57 TaxID=3374624 RepID=UPI0037AC7E4D
MADYRINVGSETIATGEADGLIEVLEWATGVLSKYQKRREFKIVIEQLVGDDWESRVRIHPLHEELDS